MGRIADRDKLTDGEAKSVLLSWSERTTVWNGRNETRKWLRGQPNLKETIGPRLQAPGAGLFRIQPDGLWIRLFGEEPEPFADVMALEVCGSVQNLNDKRARYMSSTASLMLRSEIAWLRSGAKSNPNWMAANFEKEPTKTLTVPVRHMRVLYALSGDDYDDWQGHGVLAGHEFMCLHSSLRSFASPPFQTFLSGMAPSTHFYIQGPGSRPHRKIDSSN